MAGRLAVVLAVGLVAAGERAEAQGGGVEEARRLFYEGVAAAGRHEFRAALDLFGRSYELNPNPKATFNIALCHRHLGNAPAAVEALHVYLEQGGEELPEARRAREMIRELAGDVGALHLTVSDPGARVAVDGEDIGASPLARRLFVEPGVHVARASWADGEVQEQTIAVPAWIAQPVTLVLSRPETVEEPFPRPHPEGRLPPWPFWSAVGATGACGVSALLTLIFADVTYNDWVAGGWADDALRDRGRALDIATLVLAGLTGAALVAGTVLFFYTDFGGGDEQPPADDGVALGLFPGALVLRW